MSRLSINFKFVVVVLFFSAFEFTGDVKAAETDLCPNGYTEGVVTTAYVDCHRVSSNFIDIEDAEFARLQREAVCNATPNAEVTFSAVEANSSGRFFARLTCRVNRSVPATVAVCPDESQEVFRAFDTLVCQYFGSAVETAQQGADVLNQQSTECVNSVGGQVLQSSLRSDVFDEIPFFYTELACAVTIAATDIFECPFGFSENDRDEDSLECEFNDNTFTTLGEAENSNSANELICVETTASLGEVSESLVGMTSSDDFFNTVVCDIAIPRYGPFADDAVLRACDASCTEQVSQSRNCLNGGETGGPGCSESNTQVIDRSCNTGTDRAGLCPLNPTTFTVIPLLILDEEDE